MACQGKKVGRKRGKNRGKRYKFGESQFSEGDPFHWCLSHKVFLFERGERRRDKGREEKTRGKGKEKRGVVPCRKKTPAAGGRREDVVRTSGCTGYH